MIKFSDVDYVFFDSKGIESKQYRLGRDIVIEYKGKRKKDIPKLVMDMMVEHFQGSVIVMLRTNNILFQVNFIYLKDGIEHEDTLVFLSTPSSYEEVFDL